MPKNYIKRDIETKLISLSKSFPAIALTGPRQSGKSTLLKHLFGKTHEYITFDDPLTRERAISDPKLFIDELKNKVIIDEIQYVPEILSYIKIAIDNKRQVKGSFLLTGSQQFTMIKNLGDTLAGRIALLELLPFSSNEIMGNKKTENTMNTFVSSCLRGSYPELITEKKIDLDSWYGSYISTYIERDVKSIYDIGNLRDFHRFLQLLASRTAQLINLSTYANELGASVNTIKKWLSILEASRIIHILSPYYENMGKRIVKSPKVNFLDCGIVCYLTGIKDKKHLINGPMAGALFETFCIQETIKTFFNQGIKPEIYFLRTSNDLEIDLIIRGKNNTLFPFEIKFTKTPRPSMSSNIEKFKTLFTNLKISRGNIISLTGENLTLSKETHAIRFNDYIENLKKIV